MSDNIKNDSISFTSKTDVKEIYILGEKYEVNKIHGAPDFYFILTSKKTYFSYKKYIKLYFDSRVDVNSLLELKNTNEIDALYNKYYDSNDNIKDVEEEIVDLGKLELKNRKNKDNSKPVNTKEEDNLNPENIKEESNLNPENVKEEDNLNPENIKEEDNLNPENVKEEANLNPENIKEEDNSKLKNKKNKDNSKLKNRKNKDNSKPENVENEANKIEDAYSQI